MIDDFMTSVRNYIGKAKAKKSLEKTVRNKDVIKLFGSKKTYDEILNRNIDKYNKYNTDK